MPRALSLILAIVVCAAPVAAQGATDSTRFSPAGRRNGMRLWVGLEHVTVSSGPCAGCAESPRRTSAGAVAAGWPIGRHVVVGYDVMRTVDHTWLPEMPGTAPPVVSIHGPTAYWYPPRLHHLALHGGIGRSEYRFVSGATDDYSRGRRVHLRGTAWRLGASYDFWWAPHTATGFAPMVTWTRVPKGRGSNRVTSPATHRQGYSLLQLGMAMIVR